MQLKRKKNILIHIHQNATSDSRISRNLRLSISTLIIICEIFWKVCQDTLRVYWFISAGVSFAKLMLFLLTIWTFYFFEIWTFVDIFSQFHNFTISSFILFFFSLFEMLDWHLLLNKLQKVINILFFLLQPQQ